MSMTPTQQTALESLAGRALTEGEVTSIGGMVAAWDTQGIADALSAGRTEVRSRLVTARGLAEGMPGGPLAAEAVLMKLEAARDAMLADADAGVRVMGSLLRRQLNFLAGDDGLDFGSPALRGMLDTFASQDVLTEGEVAGLKSLAVYPAPVTHTQVARALQGAAE